MNPSTAILLLVLVILRLIFFIIQTCLVITVLTVKFDSKPFFLFYKSFISIPVFPFSFHNVLFPGLIYFFLNRFTIHGRDVPVAGFFVHFLLIVFSLPSFFKGPVSLISRFSRGNPVRRLYNDYKLIKAWSLPDWHPQSVRLKFLQKLSTGSFCFPLKILLGIVFSVGNYTTFCYGLSKYLDIYPVCKALFENKIIQKNDDSCGKNFQEIIFDINCFTLFDFVGIILIILAFLYSILLICFLIFPPRSSDLAENKETAVELIRKKSLGNIQDKSVVPAQPKSPVIKVKTIERTRITKKEEDGIVKTEFYRYRSYSQEALE